MAAYPVWRDGRRALAVKRFYLWLRENVMAATLLLGLLALLAIGLARTLG